MTKSEAPADLFKKVLVEASNMLANTSRVFNAFAHTGFNLSKTSTTLLPI